ncbi:MAG: hypothetical protein WDW36_002829 [Sanguina aurantia]
MNALLQLSDDLSNFNNNFVCPLQTLIVRPRNIADIQAAVVAHDRIRGNGEGHSWNLPFFCANTSTLSHGKTSANIQLTTVRPHVITVNETAETVTVDAGVKTIDLLDYLGNYVTKSAPAGWTLPAFPWFVYQSIGGAVSTGSHGSSMQHGSLSSQCESLTLVLANGTLLTLSDATHPFLMRAARVSVGKLGILVRLTLRIVREQPVTRILRSDIPASRFLASLREAQGYYKANGTLPAWCDETEWFWIVQRNTFMMVSFLRGDSPDPAVRSAVLAAYVPESTTVYNTSAALLADAAAQYNSTVGKLPLDSNATYGANGVATEAQQVLDALNANAINAPLPASILQQYATPAVATITELSRKNNVEVFTVDQAVHGVSWAAPEPRPLAGFYAVPEMAGTYSDLSRAAVAGLAQNATLEAHESYLYQPLALLDSIQKVTFDQYETAVSANKMADCFEGLLHLVYGNDTDGLNDTQS